MEAPAHTFLYEHPYFLRDRPDLVKEISGGKRKNPPPPPSLPSSNEESKSLSNGGSAPATLPRSSYRENQESVSNSQRASFPPNLQRQVSKQANASSSTQHHNLRDYDRQIQSDLDKQLLLRSMISPSSGRNSTMYRLEELLGSQQQELLTSTILANERQRMAMSLARSSDLGHLLSGSAGLGTLGAFPMAPLAAERATLASLYQQRNLQSLSSNTVAAASSLSPTAGLDPVNRQSTIGSSASSTAAAAALDPLVRLYLQQEASRHDNLLLQQEVLRQEILRRQQEQRDANNRRPS
jgi:hypothetical protein